MTYYIPCGNIVLGKYGGKNNGRERTKNTLLRVASDFAVATTNFELSHPSRLQSEQIHEREEYIDALINNFQGAYTRLLGTLEILE